MPRNFNIYFKSLKVLKRTSVASKDLKWRLKNL